MFNTGKFNIFRASIKMVDSFNPFINFNSFCPNAFTTTSTAVKFFNFRSFANNSSDSTLNMKYSEFIEQAGIFIGKLRFRKGNGEAASLFETLCKGLLPTIDSKPNLYVHLWGAFGLQEKNIFTDEGELKSFSSGHNYILNLIDVADISAKVLQALSEFDINIEANGSTILRLCVLTTAKHCVGAYFKSCTVLPSDCVRYTSVVGKQTGELIDIGPRFLSSTTFPNPEFGAPGTAQQVGSVPIYLVNVPVDDVRVYLNASSYLKNPEVSAFLESLSEDSFVKYSI